MRKCAVLLLVVVTLQLAGCAFVVRGDRESWASRIAAIRQDITDARSGLESTSDAAYRNQSKLIEALPDALNEDGVPIRAINTQAVETMRTDAGWNIRALKRAESQLSIISREMTQP